jgi:acetyltransferase-like isoleucine patch superfamily enzyme
MNTASIHPLADIQTRRIGKGTRVWQFVVALPGAVIGDDCNICAHCFIENDVVVGDRVTIKNGVQLWDGCRIGNDVFIGPNATFTNDRHPKSGNRSFKVQPIMIENDAVIGASAVLLPGIRIGAGATVAAGAVVTKDVPAGALVMGNPARVVGSTGHVDQQL